MLKRHVRPDGKTVYTGNKHDLKALTEWTRALCHAVYGPEEGERKFRQIPAKVVLDLWIG